MKRFNTWLHQLSLHDKVMVLALSMLVLLSSALGLLLWNSLYDINVRQMEQRGVEIANHIASLSADHILTDSRYTLHELVNESQKSHTDVRYVFILDSERRLLAHTFGTGVPRGLLEANDGSGDKTASHIVSLQTSEGMIRDIEVPVEHGEAGYVRVGMLEDPLLGQIAARLRNLIVLTLLVCAIAALFAAKLASLITQPLSALAQVARAISVGNLNVRIPSGGDDEVGTLAKAFQHMAASLAANNAERSRLHEELARKERLRKILLNKVLTAQEDERKRISRELHDETGQALTSLLVSMRVLADKSLDAKERKILLDARDLAAGTLRNIRSLAVELRPPAIDDLGLVPAMRKYLLTFEEHHGVTVEFQAQGGRVHNQTAVALYRILQESLTNIVKHAGATRVQIRLTIEDNHIELVISDDGHGFDKKALETAQRENRLGLYGMRERAELLGGTLTTFSTPDQGTTITVIVPNPKEG